MDSQATSTPDPGSAGYSLLELLIALAILSLALTLVLPNGMRALDRIVLHSVLFEFQTDLARARNEAYQTESVMEIASQPGPLTGSFSPRPGWSASVSGPLTIRVDGTCSPGELAFQRDSEPMMQVRVSEDCQARRVR